MPLLYRHGLRVTDHAPANEGSRRLLAAASAGERLDQRLWTGAAAVTGARGNTTSLVGTPRQVAEALLAITDSVALRARAAPISSARARSAAAASLTGGPGRR